MKATEFTLYQVWDENSDNGKRVIVNDTDKQWQQSLIAEQKRTGFAPTTIMEIGNCKWAFVITNAYYNKNRLVFDVSTKEIVNLSKTVKTKLPLGMYKNVRMDIDSLSNKTNTTCTFCKNIFSSGGFPSPSDLSGCQGGIGENRGDCYNCIPYFSSDSNCKLFG